MGKLQKLAMGVQILVKQMLSATFLVFNRNRTWVWGNSPTPVLEEPHFLGLLQCPLPSLLRDLPLSLGTCLKLIAPQPKSFIMMLMTEMRPSLNGFSATSKIELFLNLVSWHTQLELENFPLYKPLRHKIMIPHQFQDILLSKAKWEL